MMKPTNMNRPSTLSRILWLLLFAALGCSQRSCSCKRLETIKQEIVITDKLCDHPGDKFPTEFINLLYIRDADTLPPGFKPNSTLRRLDCDIKTGDVQNTGLNGWQSFMRSIFPLSPDNYNPDLEKRFLLNEAGNDLSVKSPMSDSIKILTLNKYLLKELQSPQKCRLFFYSANIQNNSYCCRIDLSDTTAKPVPLSAISRQSHQKTGKRFGCATTGTAFKKNLPEKKKLDTIFQVFHSTDSINTLISIYADSVIQNKSGCSVKNNTIKYIIIYEPPIACLSSISDSTTEMRGTSAPDTKFLIDPVNAKPCSKNDTTVINQHRRQIIEEFRDLLFMYAKTRPSREQDFFKASALNKIHEIPDVRLEIFPKPDISALFTTITMAEADWSFTPILDPKKCFMIVGVSVQQKNPGKQ